MNITDEGANAIIENVYNTIIELIRARLMLTGYQCRGEGAHEAEISYLHELGFEDHDIRFVNLLRYNRNQILYKGKRFNKEYAEKVFEFLSKKYNKIKPSP